MASSIRSCSVKECKRPCRALCMCCQQYLCREHLTQHDNLINDQLPILTDQINVLSDQLNNSILLELPCLTDLNQWREEAHRTVDQFYEKKHQDFEELIQKKRENQRKELNQMRNNLTELIREQDATKEQIDSMTQSIQFLEQDVNDLQKMHYNIHPLVIDDNLITIPQTTVSQNFLPQTMSSTVNNQTHQKRSLFSSDGSSSKSIKLTRWDIEHQSAGITDPMRINILNTLSTLIDTHRSSEVQEIANDMKNWLNEMYGQRWTVEIVNTRKYQSSNTDVGLYYLRVRETKLEWTIVLFRKTEK